jgi:hypothetical protein
MWSARRTERERRHVVRQLHQPLQAPPPGDVGAGQDPGLEKTEGDGEHGGDARHQRGVGQHVIVVDQVGVVVEAVFLGRKSGRVADVQ